MNFDLFNHEVTFHLANSEFYNDFYDYLNKLQEEEDKK